MNLETAGAALLALLAETTVAGCLALVVILALRRPLRRGFGAGVGYALWLLLPASLMAMLLPASVVALPPVSMVPAFGLAVPVAAPVAAAGAAVDGALWLCVIWCVGALVSGWRQWRQQRAFVRGLGPLQRRDDGLLQATGVAGLPAAFGLWRPEVVLPADFDTRYTPAQQAMMRAHERSHIAHGDLHLSALAAALRCLFWFNPLAHVAARCFRHDQELACDQRVIARHPQSRRAYGEAMLNTQLAAQPLPAGCHWLAFDRRHPHPLKERIAMLKQPVPKFFRRLGGAALIAALTGVVGFSAWAAQPARISADSARTVPAPPPVPPGPPSPPASTPPPAPLPPPPPPASSIDPAVAAPAPPPPAPPQPPRPPQPPQPAVATAPSPRLVPPSYPAAAVEQKISGRVMLLIDIDQHGNPTRVVVEKAQPAGVFDQAAVDAAKQWKFEPAMQDGEPVQSRVRVPVDFAIPPADPDGASGLPALADQNRSSGIFR